MTRKRGLLSLKRIYVYSTAVDVRQDDNQLSLLSREGDVCSIVGIIRPQISNSGLHHLRKGFFGEGLSDCK